MISFRLHYKLYIIKHTSEFIKPLIFISSRFIFISFRFSQTFIDIREKERKRLQRGLVSIPPKHPKLDDDKFPTDRNDTNNNNENDSSTVTAINREDNPNGFKPEHLLELQEKITKEILSTKLREDEMHELQVEMNKIWFSW